MTGDKASIKGDMLSLFEAIVLIIILIPILIIAYPIHWITKKVFE